MPAAATAVFEFHDPATDFPEVEDTFRLAVLAAESLHGTDRLALEATYRVDTDRRTVEVDRSTDCGGSLCLIFLGYSRREYGEHAFRMRRLDGGGGGGGGGEGVR